MLKGCEENCALVIPCVEGKEADSQRILCISEAFRLWIKNDFCLCDFIFEIVIQPEDPFCFRYVK